MTLHRAKKDTQSIRCVSKQHRDFVALVSSPSTPAVGWVMTHPTCLGIVITGPNRGVSDMPTWEQELGELKARVERLEATVRRLADTTHLDPPLSRIIIIIESRH